MQKFNDRFGANPRLRFLAIAFVFALAIVLNTRASYAGGGPENLLLVVNSNSESSKLIANHYVQLRDIPARNIVYLDRVPKYETITLPEFKNRILLPVLTQIKARKLEKQIDYIVYSSDFPTRVNIGKLVNDYLLKAADSLGSRRLDEAKKIYKGHASINALTYFARRLIANDPTFISLDANKYMRGRNNDLLRNPFVGTTQGQFEKAIRDAEQGNLDQAIQSMAALAKKHPQQVAVQYWLARFHGKGGNNEKAVAWLKVARQSGWSYRSFTRADSAFATMRDDAAFEEVLSAMPDDDYRFLPTRGFKNRHYWGRNGMINGSLEQGEPYVLSTVLAVTRNQGTTEQEAIEMLRRSVAADHSMPQGTFYFSQHKDVRSRTRQPGFFTAIQQLEELGHRAEITTDIIPRQKRDILGLVAGISKFSMAQSGSRIVPGAICENLTSFGGAMQMGVSQTKLSEFIRHGAAGASGTIIEPYAVQAKFPEPRIHVHYARGCSLAEAFYQSVHGPFQLLIVGDPLCQPFAQEPIIEIDGLTANQQTHGLTTLTFDYSKSPVVIGGIDVFLDGRFFRRIPPGEEFRFDSNSLPDGFHELRFVSVANNAIRQTGRTIVPFVVNNQDQSIELTAKSESAVLKGNFQVKVSTNQKEKLEEPIEIWNNHRKVGTVKPDNLKALIPAKLLGRGPNELYAVMRIGDQMIHSEPLKVLVTGAAKTTKVRVPNLKPSKPKTPE